MFREHSLRLLLGNAEGYEKLLDSGHKFQLRRAHELEYSVQN